MVYTVMSTQVTGYIVLATDWNNIVNNFIASAIDIVTTDGDMVVATGADALERVAAMTAANLLKHEVGGLELDISGVVAGDGFYGSGAGTIGRNAAMTQAQAEAGTETEERPVTAQRIRQAIDALAGNVAIFIPATAGDENTAVQREDPGTGYSIIEFVDGVTDASVLTGFLPYTPTTISIVAFPEGSGDVRLSFATDFGASGESRSANTDSIAVAQYAVTNITIVVIDVTAAFTGAVLNDYFGISMTREGGNASDTINASFKFLGLLIEP